MTAYEQILQEGIERGIERGIEQGKQQGEWVGMTRTVRGALKIGMDAQTIADTFDLSLTDVITIIAQIRSATA